MTAAPAVDPVVAALVAVAFLGGVGAAAIGPGGVFLSAALYALTARAPGAIAGTTSSTFLAGGLAGTLAYGRSGELAEPGGRRLAALLSVASAAGAFAGSQLNAQLSADAFGAALAGFVVLAGALVWARPAGSAVAVDPGTPAGGALFAGIGLAVGVPSGLLGVGGPVLAVPALVLAGVPLLSAVAAAQVQSVFIAGAATFGYALRGTVDPALLAAVAPPYLVGIAVGWRIAHRVPAARLRRALAVALLAVGAWLLVR